MSGKKPDRIWQLTRLSIAVASAVATYYLMPPITQPSYALDAFLVMLILIVGVVGGQLLKRATSAEATFWPTGDADE